MAEVKKLYRLPKEGKIAGVAAGVAEYFEVDVTLMRVIFVVAALATEGLGVLVYIVMAVLLPEKGKDASHTKATDYGDNIQRLASDLKGSGERGSTFRNTIGLGLIIIGAWLLVSELFPGWWKLPWDTIWPALLIALGFVTLVKSRS